MSDTSGIEPRSAQGGNSQVTFPLSKQNGGTGQDNSTGVAQNAVFAGPASGGAGAAGFRTLQAADLPTLPRAKGGLGKDASNVWWNVVSRAIAPSGTGVFYLAGVNFTSFFNNAEVFTVPPGHAEAGGLTLATIDPLAVGESITLEMISVNRPAQPSSQAPLSPAVSVQQVAGEDFKQNAVTAGSLAGVRYVALKVTIVNFAGPYITVAAGSRP